MEFKKRQRGYTHAIQEHIIKEMLAEFKNSLTQKEVEAYEKEADIRALNAIYDNRPEILKRLRDNDENK